MSRFLRHTSALAISLIILTACSEDGETNLGRFTVSEDFDNIRIEGSTEAQLAGDALLPLELDLTASADFPDEGEYDFLTSVEIVGVELFVSENSEDAVEDDLENGIPDDFAFLESLTLSIEADIDGQTQSAVIASVPAGDARLDEGSRRFSLDTSEEDILMFVEADDGYRVTFDATGTPPPDDVVFGGSVEYRARVGFR